MTDLPRWASEDFWRKVAISVTALMTVFFIILSFHTLSVTAIGGKRVPPFTVVNHRIDYRFNNERHLSEPVIGKEAPLFGRRWTEAEAERLVNRGKKTIQAKNCTGCHTFLGNGSYFAPDLTKAWLDPQWEMMQLVTQRPTREEAMVEFLLQPDRYALGFGTGRRMPRLNLTREEAEGVVAYLKWMAAIDTNGFPAHFKAMREDNE
jgi:nitric oxide reductase subunit C